MSNIKIKEHIESCHFLFSHYLTHKKGFITLLKKRKEPPLNSYFIKIIIINIEKRFLFIRKQEVKY